MGDVLDRRTEQMVGVAQSKVSEGAGWRSLMEAVLEAADEQVDYEAAAAEYALQGRADPEFFTDEQWAVVLRDARRIVLAALGREDR